MTGTGMIGSSISHFRITSSLGRGGMGVVYRAEDSRLGREVAIKVLPGELTTDPERLARFEREAQVVAGLNHANICSLYDVGHDGGHHYLVMELVEGEPLDRRLERGIEPGEALRIAEQIAAALEVAHARGIVHRDLKPANVMIDAGGTVKVLDFGLAKGWANPEESGSDLAQSPTVTHRMTQAGVILGTAGYMSPEQARGEEVDQRADIWAWGVILYEMLTGSRLFDGPTLSDTLAAVLRADPEWERLPRETPRWVRRLLRRCLERDVRNRLHAIADARLELTSPEPEGADASGSSAGTRTRRGWARLAALAVALGLAIGAVGWWVRPPAGDRPLRVLEVASGSRLTNIAISPDGGRVVLSRGGKLFVRDLDSAEESEIPGVEDAVALWTLFWSPDGRRIGYVTPDEIYTVPVSGGAPQRVCEIPDSTFSEGVVLGASWYRKDTLVFGLDARGLWQVPVMGGEPELLLLPDREGKREAALHHPVLMPDGETLAARVRWRERANDTVTFLRDGERSDVTFPGWEIEKAVVTPSGYLVFSRDGQDAGIWAAPFSLDELRTTGDPVRLLAGRFQGLSISDDETLVTVAARESRARMVIIDRQGKVLREIDGLEYERDPAVSPEGGKIAVWGIRVHDGQRVVEVTRDLGFAPAWSPDGRELVYRNRTGLFRVPADGSREPVQLAEGRIATPHWSPDGKRVAFSTVEEREGVAERDVLLGRDETADILILGPGGSGEARPFRDSPSTELYPRFSPDGRFLAYASDVSGRFEVYVTSFPDGERRWQVSNGGGRFPRWSPAGDEIFFVAGGQLMSTSFRAEGEIAIGAPRRLLSTHHLPYRFSGFGQSSYDVTPDGHFAVMQLDLEDATGALLVQSWPKLYERAR